MRLYVHMCAFNGLGLAATPLLLSLNGQTGPCQLCSSLLSAGELGLASCHSARLSGVLHFKTNCRLQQIPHYQMRWGLN